jgi:hypothetical protein
MSLSAWFFGRSDSEATSNMPQQDSELVLPSDATAPRDVEEEKLAKTRRTGADRDVADAVQHQLMADVDTEMVDRPTDAGQQPRRTYDAGRQWGCRGFEARADYACLNCPEVAAALPWAHCCKPCRLHHGEQHSPACPIRVRQGQDLCDTCSDGKAAPGYTSCCYPCGRKNTPITNTAHMESESSNQSKEHSYTCPYRHLK